MADFVQMMRDWRRMCQYMTKMFGNNRCNMCSLVRCEAIYEDYGGMNYADVENKVNAWAAEHQEPVYPRWVEWMIEQGLCGADVAIITQKAYERIPADIAQKLGLQPKEE